MLSSYLLTKNIFYDNVQKPLMQKIPSIVAPGGSYDKALTAAYYGADEIYMGVPFTSLRMRQNKMGDFTKLKNAIDAIHALEKRVLLTMNIFPRNKDIKIFEAVVEKVADLGADGIIFSDPGTFRLLKKYMPNADYHLSTQTSTLNYGAVRFWQDLGVKRIVLARELHINEIKEIKNQVPEMELEVFVHGAVCMSYSGRCLLGDYMDGRPGNKGECSHACRFGYKIWLEEERRPGKFFELEVGDDGTNYILSSKDLCTIERLGELLPFVDALKIEGRSKSEFYAGTTVKAYKHVRDAILQRKAINPEIQNLVEMIPHREYWSGFLFNDLKNFPDNEEKSEQVESVNHKRKEPTETAKEREASISSESPGPLFARNYFGQLGEKTLEQDGKIYYQIDPKENIYPDMQLHYLTPEGMGVVKVTGILGSKAQAIDKLTCNTPQSYINLNQDL